MTQLQKINQFLDWLVELTEYGDWHDNVQNEVRKKMIEIFEEEKDENQSSERI